MKILVITRNAWDDTNAIGNTLSNFFTGMVDAKLANIYFRPSSPNNKICSRYFQLSEIEVLKKWFHPQSIGKEFKWWPSDARRVEGSSGNKGKKLIRFIQKHKVKLAYSVSDNVWYSERWINDRLDAFVEDFAPDIIFTFAKSAPQYYLIIKHLREKFRIPLVTWIADDEYTPLFNAGKKKELAQLKYVIKESAVVKGCSVEICEYYNSIYGCSATPLYKGCEFDDISVRKKTQGFIKLVYAGNLLYGRTETICMAAKAISLASNKIGKKSIFEIYSNTALNSDDARLIFGEYPCISYKGKIDYDTVKQQLSHADIVMLVESFDQSQIEKTRYSFSTKIIDCLQCGSAVLAIGPGEIASIRYLKNVPGVYVIDNLSELSVRLAAILRDSKSYSERAEEIRQFAMQYHSASSVRANVKEAIMLAVAEVR